MQPSYRLVSGESRFVDEDAGMNNNNIVAKRVLVDESVVRWADARFNVRPTLVELVEDGVSRVYGRGSRVDGPPSEGWVCKAMRA